MDHNDKAIPDVDAIEARANAATPEPWTPLILSRMSDQYITTTIEHPAFKDDNGQRGWGLFEHHAGNVTFTAAARTDVPALCAHVRRLTADNERLRGLIRDALTFAGDMRWDELCERFTAELERKP